MAQTKVVIVYSPNQNKRRTTIIPNDDSEVAGHAANIASGEMVMIGDLSDYRNIGPDAMLVTYTGQQATSDRCIVIAQNTVAAVILGDPLIDKHPLGTLAIDVTGKATIGLPVINNVAQIPVVVSDAIGEEVIA